MKAIRIHRQLSKCCLVGALLIVFSYAAMAQYGPVDISLEREGDELIVSVMNQGATFSENVSNFVFTLRWETASGASLEIPSQYCYGGMYLSNIGVPVEEGGYSYQTFNALGFQHLIYACPTQIWTTQSNIEIMRIKVIPGTSCTGFEIADDNFVTANNRAFFISLNGVNHTGNIIGDMLPSAGSVCDDGDPATAYSVWDANCNCVPAECLQLELYTDGSPEETTWEFNASPLITGGPYPGQANTTISTTFFVPTDECYGLTVFDSGNNGMCCGNGQGGYLLKTCSGDIIIDNREDGEFGAQSGISCAIDLCFPLGDYSIMGTTDNTIVKELFRVPGHCHHSGSQPIQAEPSPGVTAEYGTSSNSGYRFQFFDPDGLESGHSAQNRTSNCVLSDVGTTFCRHIFQKVNGPHFPYGASGPLNQRYTFTNPSQWYSYRPRRNVWYNVRVQERIDGVHGNFGPAARIMFVTPGTNGANNKLLEEGLVISLPNLSVWPNPVNADQVNIALSEIPEDTEEIEIRAINMLGQNAALSQIRGTTIFQGQWGLDISKLAAGVYFIEVKAGEQIWSERIVKAK